MGRESATLVSAPLPCPPPLASADASDDYIAHDAQHTNGSSNCHAFTRWSWGGHRYSVVTHRDQTKSSRVPQRCIKVYVGSSRTSACRHPVHRGAVGGARGPCACSHPRYPFRRSEKGLHPLHTSVRRNPTSLILLYAKPEATSGVNDDRVVIPFRYA